MSKIDELTVERYALVADQALCECEAARGRRLTRPEAERIVGLEIKRAARGVDPVESGYGINGL